MKVVIYSGGTLVHVAPHFSLCAPAYGKVGRDLFGKLGGTLYQTKMAHSESKIETNDDLKEHLLNQLEDESITHLIMAAAICDWEPDVLVSAGNTQIDFGKDVPRLSSSKGIEMYIEPSQKLVQLIKERRPDITLVTFKTTSDAPETLYEKCVLQQQQTKADYVVGNDIKTRHNILYTKYSVVSGDRGDILERLAEVIRDE